LIPDGAKPNEGIPIVWTCYAYAFIYWPVGNFLFKYNILSSVEAA
jgi:hypothetical protein